MVQEELREEELKQQEQMAKTQKAASNLIELIQKELRQHEQKARIEKAKAMVQEQADAFEWRKLVRQYEQKARIEKAKAMVQEQAAAYEARMKMLIQQNAQVDSQPSEPNSTREEQSGIHSFPETHRYSRPTIAADCAIGLNSDSICFPNNICAVNFLDTIELPEQEMMGAETMDPPQNIIDDANSRPSKLNYAEVEQVRIPPFPEAYMSSKEGREYLLKDFHMVEANPSILKYEPRFALLRKKVCLIGNECLSAGNNATEIIQRMILLSQSKDEGSDLDQKEGLLLTKIKAPVLPDELDAVLGLEQRPAAETDFHEDQLSQIQNLFEPLLDQEMEDTKTLNCIKPTEIVRKHEEESKLVIESQPVVCKREVLQFFNSYDPFLESPFTHNQFFPYILQELKMKHDAHNDYLQSNLLESHAPDPLDHIKLSAWKALIRIS